MADDLPRLVQGLDVAAAKKKRLKPRTAMDLVQTPAFRRPLSLFLVPRDPWDGP